MADTYHAINQLLIDADILPQIKAMQRRTANVQPTVSHQAEQTVKYRPAIGQTQS